MGYPKGTVYTCHHCDSESELSSKRYSEPKFCDKECYHAFRAEQATTVEITCEECGKVVERGASQADQRFCSYECRGNAQKQRYEVDCEQCGKPIEKTKWNYENRDRHLCSRDCWDELRSTAKTIPCQNCGDMLTRASSVIERAENNFCTHSCHAEYRRESISLSCEECGKGLTRKPSEAEKNDRHFCSVDCRMLFFEGEVHPQFNDSVTTQEIASRYLDGGTTWSIAEEFDVSQRLVHSRLVKSDVELRGEGGWGEASETSFGLLVRSSYELSVAEYLHSIDVDFSYEPTDFSGPYSPDFVLDDDTVVEVWGMMTEEWYVEKRFEKEQWYTENDYDLISIEPDDLSNLNAIFADYRDEPAPKVLDALAW